MAKLDGIKKADAIIRVVARCVESKAWRSECEKEALAWLDKSEKARRADVVTYVREAYDAAGAGSAGRWQ